MSLNFCADGEYIWDPAVRVGEMFIALATGASEAMDTQSGLIVRRDGTCVVDVSTFRVFAESLRAWYFSTNHPVQRQQIHGVLLISLVLLDRAGRPATASNEEEAAIVEEASRLGLSMARG